MSIGNLEQEEGIPLSPLQQEESCEIKQGRDVVSNVGTLRYVDIIELLFVALEHWKHRAGVRNRRPVEEIPLRSRRRVVR